MSYAKKVRAVREQKEKLQKREESVRVSINSGLREIERLEAIVNSETQILKDIRKELAAFSTPRGAVRSNDESIRTYIRTSGRKYIVCTRMLFKKYRNCAWRPCRICCGWVCGICIRLRNHVCNDVFASAASPHHEQEYQASDFEYHGLLHRSSNDSEEEEEIDIVN